MSMTINDKELSALNGLPHLQRLVYLQGIRPYVDYKTGIAGIKRGISYQSIAESLYVEPHPGVKSVSYNKEQLRRAIKNLERIGLISIKSGDWQLVIHCILVTADNSVQNKADTMSTPQTDIKSSVTHPFSSSSTASSAKKADRTPIQKTDIPLLSEKDYMCVTARFNQFWELYPKKNSKQRTWEEFQKLELTEELFNHIITALQQQLDATSLLQSQGLWTPKWKFPANWLAQHCWDDEIDTSALTEKQHAINQTTLKQQPVDLLWEACKGGLQ